VQAKKQKYMSLAINNQNASNSAIFIIHLLLVCHYISSCTTECNRIRQRI